MKTFKFNAVNGSYEDTSGSVTASGSNDGLTHNVYVAFTQLDSGSLTVQYKPAGGSNWKFVGKVDLTSTEVAEFKLTGSIQAYRFIVADASGTGSIEVTDSEKLEDIHPLSFYGETRGMSPEEIGNKLSTGSALGDGYDIILLAGQSNMIGRYGPIDAELDKADGRVFQYGNDGQVVAIAKNPLDHVDETANTVGLGLNLAKYYADNYLDKGRKVLLVPVSDGGTGFNTGYWRSGGTGYVNAVSKCNAAYATEGNNRVVLIAWNQGESDAALTESQYSDDLQSLVSGLRSDLSGASDALFICSGVNPASSQYAASIYTASMYSQFLIGDSAFVYSDDLSLGADSLHYSAESQRILGRRYGAAIRYRSIYSSDFDSELVGSTPSGITDREPFAGASAVIESGGDPAFTGNYLGWTASGGVTSSFTIDNAPVAENNIVYLNLSTNGGRIGALLRAHGDGELRNGYLVQANGNDNTFKVFKYSSGSATQVGTTINAPILIDDYYHWRFYARGDDLILDYSQDGITWVNGISTTDSQFSGISGGVDILLGFSTGTSLPKVKTIKCGSLVTD